MAIFMYIYTPHLQAWNLQIFSPFEGVKLYLLHKFMSIKKDGKNHVYCRFVHPTWMDNQAWNRTFVISKCKFLIKKISDDYLNFYFFSFRPEHFFLYGNVFKSCIFGGGGCSINRNFGEGGEGVLVYDHAENQWLSIKRQSFIKVHT